MTLSRDLMPQISKKSVKKFLSSLKSRGVSHVTKKIDTNDLKSTQSEFDSSKISSLAASKDKSKIITSNDGYVVDGHHRWLASHANKEKVGAHIVDLPCLELLRVAKEFEGNNSRLNETEKFEFDDMLDSFVSYASTKLGISKSPIVTYKKTGEGSFGGYCPGDNSIHVVTKNRHPLDVLRTLAHELVHHKQNEDGRIKDVAQAGATGSDIEDEANSHAGRLMRNWAKAYPEHFSLSSLTENVAVFVVGGPCSGKDRIVKSLKEEDLGLVETDINCLHKSRSNRLIVNASAHNIDEILGAHVTLSEKNYHTSVVFVDVSNEISKLRNEDRASKGLRVISEGVRFSKYSLSEQNKNILKEMYEGHDFVVIDNSIDSRFNKLYEENKPSDREEGTDSVVRVYKQDTPGQTRENETIGTRVNIKKLIKQRYENDVVNTNPVESGGVGVGPTFGQKSVGSGISEDVKKWMNDPINKQRYEERYGSLAETKMLEAAKGFSNKAAKPLSKIRESLDKGLLDNMGSVPSQGKEEWGEDKATVIKQNSRINKQTTDKKRFLKNKRGR